MGHLVIGAMMVEEASHKLGLDKYFTMHTEHMILSHHGKLEYGSPKTPVSLEAIMLHSADDLSFKSACFYNLVEKEKSDDLFTVNSRNPFESRLYKGNIEEFINPPISSVSSDSFDNGDDDKIEVYDDFLSLFEEFKK